VAALPLFILPSAAPTDDLTPVFDLGHREPTLPDLIRPPIV
jgi:hypothetical protein